MVHESSDDDRPIIRRLAPARRISIIDRFRRIRVLIAGREAVLKRLRSSSRSPTPERDASPPPSANMSPEKVAMLSCPYFKKIHRPDTHKQIRVPKEAAALKYKRMKLAALRERVRFVCKRTGISQMQLADFLDINNGNMSGSLSGAYKPASSRVYIYLLWQWCYQMDRKFVDELKAHCIDKEALAPDAGDEAIAAAFSDQSGLAIESVRDYLSFVMDPPARELIDVAAMRYRNIEAVLNKPPRGPQAPRKRSLQQTVVDIVARPPPGMKVDAATESILRSWHPSSLSEFTIIDDFQSTHRSNQVQIQKESASLEPFGCFSPGAKDVFINGGGLVTVLEWIATEKPDRCYLMLCTASDDQKRPALIQFYEANHGTGRADVTFKVGFCIEELGCIVAAQFCPYHLPSSSVSILGVLAVTGLDGSLAILSIPDPALFSARSFVRIVPVSRCSSPEYKFYSLAWHPTNDRGQMPILLTGTHQGSAVLFDIRRRFEKFELAIPVARTVNDCVTQVVWCTHDPFHFLIGTHSGVIRLFNLRSPQVPVWTHDAHRPIYGLKPVENGKSFIIAMAQGIRNISLSSGLSSTPLFWADLPVSGITPTSLSVLHVAPSHLVISVTTDSGLAVFIHVPNRLYFKKSMQPRIVEIMSFVTATETSQIRYSKSASPSYKVVSLSKANQAFREKARKSLPEAGSAALLLDPNLVMTRSAVHLSKQPLFASGGCSGVVRVQVMPPLRSSS